MTKADLLQRIEAANGPDRVLDGDVWHALTAKPGDVWVNDFADGVYHLQDPRDTIAYEAPPDLTASIDAAIALVERLLPGWAWFVDWIGMPDQPACHAEIWLPAQRSQHLGRERERGEASTPALAILAATLRALIAKEAEHG